MKREIKKKKTNFIIDNYKKSFDYLKESRKYVYAVVILFFVFILIGFFIPVPAAIQEKILEFIKQILEQTEGMGVLELITFIFFNNLKVSILSIVLGILFGVVPIAFSITNGYLLGYIASLTAREEGILVLWRILPHGIFELPAVFISLALGLRIGYIFIQHYYNKYLKSYPKIHLSLLGFILCLLVILSQSLNDLNLFGLVFSSLLSIFFFVIIFLCLLDKKFRKNFYFIFSNSIKIFLQIVVPLLIIAAIIEGFLIVVSR